MSRSTSVQNFGLLSSKMTELWLFKTFDLQGRGWGKNGGHIYLGNVYVYFSAKFWYSSFKDECVTTVLVIFSIHFFPDMQLYIYSLWPNKRRAQGGGDLKYLTHRFWMVRMRICKISLWLKTDAIMVCHWKETYLLANST